MLALLALSGCSLMPAPPKERPVGNEEKKEKSDENEIQGG